MGLELFDCVDDEHEPPRVSAYAGYSFGLIKHARACGFADWLSGVVVTPRWAKRCAQELELDEYGVGPELPPSLDSPDSDVLYSCEEAPSLSNRIILDNGAYPAWKKGAELSLSHQLDGIHQALTLIPTPEWIIAPDVVANASATWKRITASLEEFEDSRHCDLLLPLQDGMETSRIAALARELGCGVFVGGSGWKFKARALRELQEFDLRWIHVGRARTRPQLETCARLGADAIDSSSFLRAQHHNVAARKSYAEALSMWVWERGSPTRQTHSPRLSHRSREVFRARGGDRAADGGHGSSASFYVHARSERDER